MELFGGVKQQNIVTGTCNGENPLCRTKAPVVGTYGPIRKPIRESSNETGGSGETRQEALLPVWRLSHLPRTPYAKPAGAIGASGFTREIS